jgi:hypothetical protein
MSRGLGALQREILETLEDARHDRRGYRGFGGMNGEHLPLGHRWYLPGWVVVKGHIVRLGLQAYDLRASCIFLARKHGEMDRDQWVNPSFSASFSRAVTTLIKRGELVPFKHLMPIAAVDPFSRRTDLIQELSDGSFLMLGGRTRFVQRGGRD